MRAPFGSVLLRPRRATTLRIGLVILIASAWMGFGSLEAITQDVVLFREKIKIPYALQSGSKIVKPGEYLVTISMERGTNTLTLDSAKKRVLRTKGEYQALPESERSKVKGRRLRVFPLPNRKSPGERWIVFMFDIRGPIGDFYRIIFRCREAIKVEKK